MGKYKMINQYLKQVKGFNVSTNILKKFKIYTDLLLDWNKKMNLTGIKEEEDIILKHYIDSLSCLKKNYINNNCKVIDVGTGAGFPGLPIKIVNNNINLTLIDSLRKRIDFLNEVVKRLELNNVEIIHIRAEDLGKDLKYRESYDVAVSRAVASLPILIEYNLPFIKPKGYLIAMKGPNVDDEIKQSQNALKELKGKIYDIYNTNLLDLDINHKNIIIKKTEKSPSKYPRKAGKPTKKPL